MQCHDAAGPVALLVLQTFPDAMLTAWDAALILAQEQVTHRLYFSLPAYRLDIYLMHHGTYLQGVTDAEL